MKEGLRSGNLMSEPEEDGVLPMEENKCGDMTQKCSDSDDQESLGTDTASHLIKESEKIEERGRSENSKWAEKKAEKNEKKRIRKKGDETEDDGVVKKKMKGKSKVQFVGRVLRSNSVAKVGGENEGEGDKGEIGKRNLNGQSDSSENENVVDKEPEENDASDGGKVRKKVKGKRGRPPKVRESEDSKGEKDMVKRRKRGRPFKKVQDNDEFGDGGRKRLKGKCGRPRKDKSNGGGTNGSPNKQLLDSDESYDEGRKRLKGKRGRPPKNKSDSAGSMSCSPNEKVQDGDESDDERSKRLKGKRGRPPKKKSDGAFSKKLKGKRGRPCKGKLIDGVSKENFGKGKKDHLFGKNIKNSDDIKCGDMETEDSEAPLQLRSDMVNTSKSKGQSGKKVSETKVEQMQGTRAVKQLVRDRIVELLVGAGWTIEYRRRNGREYHDAVYVNPIGKTHWSVTLAYKVLKQHYDDGGCNSEKCKPGFTFTPIPPEELKILTKVIHKTRSDKQKERSKIKRKDGDGDEIVTKKKKIKGKLHKGKLNWAASLGGKARRKGIKAPQSLSKQDISVGSSKNGTLISSRIPKQQGLQSRKRCALLARNSLEGAESGGGGYVLYDGKRTVLSWMIELGTVPLNGKVQYMNRRKSRVILEGRITRDGIHCRCCSETFSISNFEAHAGSKLCHPYQNLYLESGTSLLQCIQDSWNKQDESERKGFHQVDIGHEDPNDDTCGICGDGGDLVCCDGCPSTFHQSCLDIEMFPSGEWHCVYCSCKFCGTIGGNKCKKDDDDDSAASVLLTCQLCEEKYHESCIKAEEAKHNDPSMSFCGKKCREIFKRLQMLLGVKHQLEGGYTWTLIHRSDVGSDLFLSDAHQQAECNAMLAVALLVMDECFLPLPDHRSGINLIHNIVYNFGSNFHRLDYRGFFTAILEKDDEIVSAASIRVHGNEIAEMPFIGTRHIYRRQGMCRQLLSGIESALCSLNVEKLVIPAISELRETWTSVFGFSPLEASNKQKMRNMSLLVFPGVDMLQKPIFKHQLLENITHPAEGLESIELEKLKTMDEVVNKADEKHLDGFDLNVSDEDSAQRLCKSNNESADVASRLELSDVSTHEMPNIKSETVNIPEPTTNTKCADEFSNEAWNEETVKNPVGSRSNADEPTKEVTANVASEGEVEDAVCDETSVDLSAEVNATERQNLDLIPKASVEDVVSQDLGTTNQKSLDLVVDKDHSSNEVKNDPESQNMPLLSHDTYHQDSSYIPQTAVSPAQVVQDVANCNSAELTADRNINSSCQANGIDTDKVDADSYCCGDVSDALPNVEKEPICLNGSITQDVIKMNKKSAEYPGSDSQVHHASVKQCNSESLCNLSPGSGVALHCGSDGGK